MTGKTRGGGDRGELVRVAFALGPAPVLVFAVGVAVVSEMPVLVAGVGGVRG